MQIYDDGSVEESRRQSEVLIDPTVEIRKEVVGIDARRLLGQPPQRGRWDKGLPPCGHRAKFGHRHTVPSHDEGLSLRHRLNDFGVVVAQLTLSDDPCHSQIVAFNATDSYVGTDPSVRWDNMNGPAFGPFGPCLRETIGRYWDPDAFSAARTQVT